MKDYSLLIWMTQLGLSVAAPLIAFLFLGLWLRNAFNWGDWVVWTGLAMGLSSAFSGLRYSLKAMQQMAQGRKKQNPPPISFNDHF